MTDQLSTYAKPVCMTSTSLDNRSVVVIGYDDGEVVIINIDSYGYTSNSFTIPRKPRNTNG